MGGDTISNVPALDHNETPSATAPNQNVLVPLLSIAVIAFSALLLRWLTVPTEVTTSLATASGALVPIIALRRADRKKAKAQKVHELVSGTFARPTLYVVMIAAGALVMIQYLSYLLVGAMAGFGLGAALDQGTITEEEISGAIESDLLIGYIAIIAFVILFIVCIPVGIYIAHRVVRRDFLWAIGAVVLSQLASLVTDLLISSLVDVAVTTYWPYLILTLGFIPPVLIGVVLGRRTRALFRASRLFRKLSESDRGAVLGMMEESQVGQRLAAS